MTGPDRPDESALDRAPLPAAAVVLAGGRSSRMGQPKALLPFDGVPLVTHLVNALGEAFEEVVVVASTDQVLPPLAARLVRDEVAFQGPVGGLYYGLSGVTRDAAFVTSCDAPFLDLRLIRHLTHALSDADVVVPFWDGRAQPLHAVYRREVVVPQLAQQLARGELRPVALFDRVRTRRVLEDEIMAFDPEGWSFFNMNTPDDYMRALAHWRAARSAPPT